MPAPSLSGKTVFITGAAAGIGFETALAFSRQGANIIATDVDPDGLAELDRQISTIGTTCRSEILDVSDEALFEQLAQQLANDDMVPDIVVNNAGIGMMDLFANTDTDTWRHTFDINLFGVVFGCRNFIRLWQANGRPGHLVNIASAASFAPMPNLSAYSASKYAVEGLSEVLALEYADTNIAISCIHPGVINTAIVSHRDRSRMSDQQTARLQYHYSTEGTPPSVVADAIVKAVQNQRGNVYVGAGAQLAAVAKRLLPRAWFRKLLRKDAAKIGYL